MGQGCWKFFEVELMSSSGQHQKKGGVLIHVFCYSFEGEMRSINSAFIMVNIRKSLISLKQ
jgi:hypothetical protein